MKLIRSNRTESLADALASAVRREPLAPFEQETIVVQSRGMERWLTLALTERLGIWSNPCFPFPRTVVEQVLQDLAAGPSEDAKGYDPGRLRWTIAQLLLEAAPVELRRYLGDPTDADRALRFSGSLAEVFDRYVVYRPELLRVWAKGEDPQWQAELWRRVVGRLGPHDLSTRIDGAVRSLRAGGDPGKLRFKRLHLFSLETLPPLFLRFLTELSKTIPTTLYSLEPSAEYIGDLDPSPQLSLAIEGTAADAHPFLHSSGRLSRDFQQMLLDFDESVDDRTDLFAAPGRSSLLTSLQTDILELRGPPEQGARSEVASRDDSISIHACTGPMREAQVVHDLVRSALESDPSLQPEEIAVMTPDLETYAPVFRAVFGQAEPHRIPFEAHDRKTREDASFYDDFLSVLEVLDSRFSVLDVVRLMDAGSMREDFRFTPEERSRLTELLAAAGVRWGIDSDHRAELEFPAEGLHTWRAGLGRLFLGFASMPQAMDVFEGLLPRGTPSLEDAELVARLSRLCEALFEVKERARRPLGVKAWVAELERLVSLLFEEDGETERATTVLRGSLRDLLRLAEASGYSGSLSLKALRRELGKLLLQNTPAVGFLSRGVSLTELVPLRSVPFRVICLMGMSEDAFPRGDDRPRFDLTRETHRAGDRTKRHDDRHSFLQAILCARDRLIITYGAAPTGLRAGANPSPIVWELCETVNQYYRASEGTALLTPTMHPLHAFDRRYFAASDLPQSFSQRNLQIARGVEGVSRERPRIELRTEPGVLEATLSVGELTSWLWNPMKAFIDGVLRARFEVSDLYEPTGALTEPSALDAARVGNAALRAGLTGKALDAYLAAAPEFPDGSWGGLQRRHLVRELGAFEAARRQLVADRELRSVRLATQLGDVQLSGRLEGLAPDRRVVLRFTRTQRKAELGAWIEHLLMQAARELRLADETLLVLRGAGGRPSIVSFRAVANPRRILGDLIDLYRSCREAPLPLLETSSRVFAERFADGLKPAVQAARKQLTQHRDWDPRIGYVLGARDPFEDPRWAESFEQASLALYGPLLEHRDER